MIDVPPISPRGFIDSPLPGIRALSLAGYGWELLTPLTYVTGSGYKIIVPAGFQTDFASIPRIFWGLYGFNPYGPAKFPAVVHDYLYSLRGGRFPDGSEGFDRRESDDILREALQLVGERRSIRDTIYYAVRLFGGWHSRKQPWLK